MRRTIVFIIIAAAIIIGTFFSVRFFLTQPRGPSAGLKITSTPTTSIFLNGKNFGRTPFENKLEPGEYTVKLIPEGPENQTVSWQGKVTISANLLTYINRDLRDSELTSSGELLWLENIGGKMTEIVITSTPENVTVQLDGNDRGTAPLSLKNVEPGDHELSFSAVGFEGKSIKIKTTAGFRLHTDIQLGLSSNASPSATPSPVNTDGSTTQKTVTPAPNKTGNAGTTVKILSTPTGWLRVRNEPSTSASESAKVNTGDTFPVLDEQNGWYKIEYESGKSGWISKRYAEKS